MKTKTKNNYLCLLSELYSKVTQFEIGWEVAEIYIFLTFCALKMGCARRVVLNIRSQQLKHVDILISINNIFSSRLLHIPQTRHAILPTLTLLL